MPLRQYIPILAPSYNKRNQTSGTNQHLINMYLEQYPNPIGGRIPTSGINTPGTSLWLSLGGGSVRGLLEHQGTGFAVSGNNVYSIDPATPTSINLGTITSSSSGRISIAADDTDITICDASHVYRIDTSSGNAFTDITSAINLGATPIWTLAKDGFFIYLTDTNNKVFVSDVSAPSTVQPLSFFTINSGYSTLRSGITSDNFVYFFCDYNTEIWYDAGSQFVPFARVAGGLFQFGTAAAASAAVIADNVYWLAQSEHGILGIVMANGPNYQIITDNNFVSKLSEYNSIDDAYAWVDTIDGHQFYNITFPNAETIIGSVTRGRTWSLDITNNNFLFERQTYNPYISDQDRHIANCKMFIQNQAIIGDFASGDLLVLSKSTYADYVRGTTYPKLWEIRTPTITDRDTYFSIYNLEINVERGQGLDGSGQGSAPEIMMQYSKDYGNTYSQIYTRPVNEIGNYSNRVRFGSLGGGRSLVLKLTGSDPINWVISGATAEIEKEDMSQGRALGFE